MRDSDERAPHDRGSDALPAAACLARIQEILIQERHRALQSVNAAMLAAYWHVGREIVEEEQRGQDRAGYGERLVQLLSDHLTPLVPWGGNRP